MRASPERFRGSWLRERLCQGHRIGLIAHVMRCLLFTKSLGDLSKWEIGRESSSRYIERDKNVYNHESQARRELWEEIKRMRHCEG